MEMNDLTKLVIGASIEVHKTLGPGLLESVYQECLVKELKRKNVFCKENVPLKIIYKGDELDKLFFIDILVDNRLILELKAVEFLLPVHKAQLLSYLRLSDKKLGLLINFNVPVLKDGIFRVVN
jgi:GxxExxY protein